MDDGLDMRGRYEQALAEVEEMKRTLREHAMNVAAREKELEQLRLDVAGRQGRRRPSGPAAPDPVQQDELRKKIADAERREKEAVQELALAKAERERLDEREQAIRKVERELAQKRMQLEEQRRKLTGSSASAPEPAREAETDGDPPPPTPLPQPPTEPELDPAAAKRGRSSMLADPQLRKRSQS